MRGDASLAWDAAPGPDTIVDIRNARSLTWSAGDGAASHDVYFGSDRKAVAEATRTSPEFKGNQAGTSFSLAALVTLGAGECFWRIDEVEAGVSLTSVRTLAIGIEGNDTGTVYIDDIRLIK